MTAKTLDDFSRGEYVGKWNNGWRFQIKRFFLFLPAWISALILATFLKWFFENE